MIILHANLKIQGSHEVDVDTIKFSHVYERQVSVLAMRQPGTTEQLNRHSQLRRDAYRCLSLTMSSNLKVVRKGSAHVPESAAQSTTMLLENEKDFADILDHIPSAYSEDSFPIFRLPSPHPSLSTQSDIQVVNQLHIDNRKGGVSGAGSLEKAERAD